MPGNDTFKHADCGGVTEVKLKVYGHDWYIGYELRAGRSFVKDTSVRYSVRRRILLCDILHYMYLKCPKIEDFTYSNFLGITLMVWY